MARNMLQKLITVLTMSKINGEQRMTRTSNLLLVAVAITGMMASCADNDAEYVQLDSDWDAADSAFMADYDAVRAENDRLTQELSATQASADSAAAARYAQTQERIAANSKALQEMDAQRSAARASRDAARTASDRAAYDKARAQANYDAWRNDLNRMRTEQKELEGTIKIGGSTVGSVDANVKDTSKPLLRVEPGKEDNKPLIELNKNPKDS